MVKCLKRRKKEKLLNKTPMQLDKDDVCANITSSAMNVYLFWARVIGALMTRKKTLSSPNQNSNFVTRLDQVVTRQNFQRCRDLHLKMPFRTCATPTMTAHDAGILMLTWSTFSFRNIQTRVKRRLRQFALTILRAALLG